MSAGMGEYRQHSDVCRKRILEAMGNDEEGQKTILADEENNLEDG